MKKLVRLWKRPSRDGTRFTYVLIYTDEQGKKRFESLGHVDARKAERQRAQTERELRIGFVEPGSMKLSQFVEDSIARTQGQVREDTLSEYDSTMRHFITIVGDIDYRSVKYQHAERFIQTALDRGNAPATVKKKIGTLKRLFQLAVQRGQLEDNPLRYVPKPKVSSGPIHVYRDEECDRIVKAARDSGIGSPLRWDILILSALCTGMRRGELLNTTWADIDFDEQVIRISPKDNTEYTWKWHIKDTDRRNVPLTDELTQLLAEHQAAQPEGYPYVFVPPQRYDRIQETRRLGRWTDRQGKCPVSNFRRQFTLIKARASIGLGTFHDLRRTCITNWFANGLSEYEVMILAGHASFDTTRKFYLAVRKDLLERARAASTEAMKEILVARQLRAPVFAEKEKGCQPQVIDSQDLMN